MVKKTSEETTTEQAPTLPTHGGVYVCEAQTLTAIEGGPPVETPAPEAPATPGDEA
jgi:hypothetical protein